MHFISNCDHYLLNSYFLTFSSLLTLPFDFAPFTECAMLASSSLSLNHAVNFEFLFSSFIFSCVLLNSLLRDAALYFTKYYSQQTELLVANFLCSALNFSFYSPILDFRASCELYVPASSAVDIIRVKARYVERLCLMFDCVSLYFYSCNSSLLLPVLSTIRFFVFSYDVIHSLGIYSFGIKIDAIPGRFNFASTIRTLIKGEHRGFCYELCGHGHSSMLLIAKTS